MLPACPPQSYCTGMWQRGFAGACLEVIVDHLWDPRGSLLLECGVAVVGKERGPLYVSGLPLSWVRNTNPFPILKSITLATTA